MDADRGPADESEHEPADAYRRMDEATDSDEPTAGHDRRAEAAIRRSRRVSHLLDEAIRVPGTDYRIGADPILGILPVAGDTVALALSLYPILEAARLGIPRSTLLRMLANVLVDAVVGSVPVVGPVFDAVWKANEWNVRLMERHLG